MPDAGRRAMWGEGRSSLVSNAEAAGGLCICIPPASLAGVLASSWFPPKCPPGQLELVSVLSGKAND